MDRKIDKREKPHGEDGVVTVINGFTEEEFTFVTDNAEEALITCYILESLGQSQIHNSAVREKIRGNIKRGKISLGVGYLTVFL
jgi:hypothetical protein